MIRDWITEAIAHFVGLFETIIEAARSRESYDEFRAARAAEEETRQLEQSRPDTEVELEQEEFEPDSDYQPLPPEVEKLAMVNAVRFEQPDPAQIGENVIYPGYISQSGQPQSSSAKALPPEFEPIGSYAVVVNQLNHLSDNDNLSIGGSGLAFANTDDSSESLEQLLSEALELAPLSELEMPKTEADIPSVIEAASGNLNDFIDAHGDDEGVSVTSSGAIQGTFVNGKAAEAAPEINDHWHKEEPEVDFTPEKVNGTDEPAIELEAGGNVAVNEAVIMNNWVVAPVIVGMGDSYEINAIVQINAWWDQDLVATEAFDHHDMKGHGHGGTKAFNVADFDRTDPSKEGSSGSHSGGDDSLQFPAQWAVSSIEGDLVMMNWIEQINFILDNDQAVLASSGVKASVVAGGNSQFNITSIEELGSYYDLIIVDGSMYDAAFIQQMNVLVDNDIVGAVNGFATSGTADTTISGTSDNLLWNQASITNIGGSDRFDPMSDMYQQFAETIANGSMSVAGGSFADSAFAGLAGIRVLHVKGSIYDLKYIKQTNIVGDNDKVALAQSQVLSNDAADWDISTGSNDLINVAAIYDVDATGSTHLLGEHYSQEILIQADIISCDPDLGGQDPNVLINEAIAFLDDQMVGSETESSENPVGAPAPCDTTHPDVMQSMLA
ncbi:hypothetical protein [Oricola thermophila]|uniref:Type I secretion protein n=1 Tax=Oricola thermophila TaxID=2742145 RepID=A0A6N1VJS5_9HYPH|nr:hypothetical protein [Oricola thermophila]QKV19177.1 hypothetical protein HTY61_12275 [Oricola thermophila]